MGIMPDAVPSTLRKINIRSTLEVLRQRGKCSRAELTRLTGVSAPTMSKLIDNLLEKDFIEEFSVDPKGKGRPSKFYCLAEKSVFIIGLVIDIKECRIVKTGLDGNINSKDIIFFSTPDTFEKLLADLKHYIEPYIHGHSDKCLGIGVSIPGLIGKNGVIELSPNIRILDNKDLGNDIKRMFGCEVTMFQEEYGMCLAERQFGSAGDCEDFIMVDVSSGLGMGVFCGNKYIHGADGFGGELGHITVKPDGPQCSCGNYGCLETLAGDKALTRKISEKLGHEISSGKVAEVVKEKNLDITDEIDEVTDYLAIGLAAAINLFNPRKIFIYGSMFDFQKNTFDKLLKKVSIRALNPALKNCTIRRSRLMKEQGAIAGICSHIFEEMGPQIDR